ncbi:hypothetical protein DFP73DRAFT_599547 [Morchella snyderi]|nr:hypothetical protein DFP73DRAFT_599547 [Morchella snyderi]
MSGNKTRSSRIKLLSLLTEDSEFLATLRDGLTDIWDNLKVFSFYELRKTPTVQKEKRFGEELVMAKKLSALLHLKNENSIHISRNHTEMAKFSSVADKDYRTVATHIVYCIKDIISREDNDEDDSEDSGGGTAEVNERRRKKNGNGNRKRGRLISSTNNCESGNDDNGESGSGAERESSTPQARADQRAVVIMTATNPGRQLGGRIKERKISWIRKLGSGAQVAPSSIKISSEYETDDEEDALNKPFRIDSLRGEFMNS